MATASAATKSGLIAQFQIFHPFCDCKAFFSLQKLNFTLNLGLGDRGFIKAGVSKLYSPLLKFFLAQKCDNERPHTSTMAKIWMG